MQEYFPSGAQVPLTSQDLVDSLEIKEEDQGKVVLQFLIQAIKNLENSLLLYIILLICYAIAFNKLRTFVV